MCNCIKKYIDVSVFCKVRSLQKSLRRRVANTFVIPSYQAHLNPLQHIQTVLFLREFKKIVGINVLNCTKLVNYNTFILN